MRWIRLVIKWHRPELLAAIAAIGAGIALAVVAWLQARSILGVSPDCFENLSSACDAASGRLRGLQTTTSGLFEVAAVLSFVVGALFGATVPGRELETGSGQLVFWLAPLRTRWLFDRLLPIGGIALLGMLTLGLVLDDLAQTLLAVPGPNGTFSWIGGRGTILVAHALFGLAAGTLAGVMVGKALPAFLLAGIASAVAALATETLRQGWLRSVAVRIVPTPDDLVLVDRGATLLVVPGWRYHEAVVRDFVVFVGLAAACFVIAAFRLERRVPA